MLADAAVETVLVPLGLHHSDHELAHEACLFAPAFRPSAGSPTKMRCTGAAKEFCSDASRSFCSVASSLRRCSSGPGLQRRSMRSAAIGVNCARSVLPPLLTQRCRKAIGGSTMPDTLCRTTELRDCRPAHAQSPQRGPAHARTVDQPAGDRFKDPWSAMLGTRDPRTLCRDGTDAPVSANVFHRVARQVVSSARCAPVACRLRPGQCEDGVLVDHLPHIVAEPDHESVERSDRALQSDPVAEVHETGVCSECRSLRKSSCRFRSRTPCAREAFDSA